MDWGMLGKQLESNSPLTSWVKFNFNHLTSKPHGFGQVLLSPRADNPQVPSPSLGSAYPTSLTFHSDRACSLIVYGASYQDT